MFAALLVIAGVIFLALAGFGVARPRFQPQWIGLALVFLGFAWPAIYTLSR